MLFLVAFVVVFSYVQSECAYTIKAGDSIYALSGALGCGNGENSNYGKLLELNKLLAGQPNAIGDFSDGKYSPGEILFVPDACYTTTLPANCKPVNDCSNGNGNDVCPSALATCTETDLAFRCACKANAMQSSTTVCSSRSSKFCTPTCVAKPTSAPGSTTKAAETTTAGAVIPGSTTGTSTKSPGSATSTDECGSLVASCDTCLSNSKCKWCASDRSCVAAELPYCGSERRSIEMCGAGCYPDSDKCCTSEGKVSKAGESCAVSANECVLPTGTCDGERPDCVAQFVADQSPCNNGNGACVSGVCKNANQCSVPALKSLSGCQTTCTADGEDVLEMCLCEGGATSPSTTCWSKDRLEKFSRGEGDDVAQYKATCPSFCSCKCTGATQSDASDNALSTLLSFVVVVAIVLFQ